MAALRISPPGTSYLGLLLPYEHPMVSALVSLSFSFLLGVEGQATPLLLGAAFGLLGGAQNALNASTDLSADRISWPERPLASGRLTARNAKAVSLGLFVAAESFVALSMILRPSAMLLLVMLADFSLRILYSSPPVRLKRFPLLGNLIASAFVVLFPLLGSVTIASKGPAALVGTGVVLFLNSLATFIMEDVVTEAGDRAVGDRTLPVLLGKRWSTRISSLIYAAALSVLLLGLTTSQFILFLVATLAEAPLIAIPLFVAEGLSAFRACGLTAAILGAILVVGQILA